MCEYIGVTLITVKLAAGDFNQGIVGDSERLLLLLLLFYLILVKIHK